jgi:hypothetical protein
MCAFNSARADAQEWVRAGVFLKRGLAGVEQFDELCGINWDWLSMEREGGEAIRTGVQVLLDNSINNLSGTDGHRMICKTPRVTGRHETPVLVQSA